MLDHQRDHAFVLGPEPVKFIGGPQRLVSRGQLALLIADTGESTALQAHDVGRIVCAAFWDHSSRLKSQQRDRQVVLDEQDFAFDIDTTLLG